MKAKFRITYTFGILYETTNKQLGHSMYYFLVDEILMKFSNNIRTAIENPLKEQLRNEDNRS